MSHKEANTNNKPYNTASISRIIIMIVTTAILIQGAIWLGDSIYLFQADIESVNQIQTDYIKTELEERVASVIDYSDYRSYESETVLREQLLGRTYEAYALMNSIYENNKDTKTKEEITEMIKDALREIRFNDGRGYFFVDTLEGDVILYPVFPESEGQNLIDLQDDHGNYAIQDEIQLVKSQGEGYIEGFWKNQNIGDGKTYKKITFVKAFEPYGWYFGCGDYLDEVTKEIQQEVLAYVNSIQYGDGDVQYVFVHDYSGVELANGVYPEFIGVNNYELEDIKGAKVYQEQIALCMEENGGFLTHYWPTIEGNGQYKKLTYVAPLEKWGWVIGTGVDMTDLDALIENKEIQMRRFIWQRILLIIFILAILLGVSMLYVKRFMAKVKKNFSVFREYMLSAKMKLTSIDVESLDYADFSDLAEVTNSMTGRINQLLHYDELTGVYNRRAIKEILQNVLAESAKTTGIILLDIDYFKKVNDSFGHEVGDETLVAIAKNIEEHTPKRGFVGRFGGEEFIIVMPDTTLEESVTVAETVRKSIEECYITSIDGSVTISGGVAYSGSWENDELFKQADRKLYYAKDQGRNRIEY